MKLFHWTHINNRESIWRRGLDPAYATGKQSCVWLHTLSVSNWAKLHVCSHHWWNQEDVILFEITVAKADVSRIGIKGVYRHWSLIDPSQFKEVPQ